MSNITLNIVAPDTPTPAPVDPVAPNTGLFTHGIGSSEATIIAVSTILLLAIVALVVFAILHKKKTGKSLIRNNKHITTAVILLAILTSAGTFIALARNAALAADTDEEANDETGLTVDVSSTEFTIELADEPVFAILPVDVTVEEVTLAGYTLTAYTDNTNLVSTTDPDNTIPMIAVDEANLSGNELATLVSLTDNTYGLALGDEPTSKDEAVYTALSIDSEEPTIIKSMTEYTPTPANDTTTIYYGFYITPDIPYGTYTNDGEVYYNATINTTLVTFDGKGLYFDEEQTQSTNTVEYIAVSQENNGTETSSTINQPISGEYKTPSQALPYRFLGWSTDPESTEPTYTSEDDIAEHLPISPNIPLTLYAVWQKATTITYDANGGTGTMDKQTIIAGESANLSPNTFTKDGYTFTGWNTDEHGEGKSYTDEELYQAEAESANVTLFAQWEKKLPVIGDLIYMQDFATLTEEDKASVLNSMYPGTQYQLEDNRDEKLYYISKLADGNIWMTQNLDHNIGDIDGGTYTSADTDLAYSNIGTTWTPNRSAYTKQTSDTSWDDKSYNSPESYDSGDRYWNGVIISNQETCEANSGTWKDYYCDGADTTSSTGDGHFHLGNYYNWTAATALSDRGSYTTATDVNQSICPAGWMLPKGGWDYYGSGSFTYLKGSANLTAGANGNAHIDPTYFVYGGSWSSSGSFRLGMSGVYLSSVTYDDNNLNAGALFIYANVINVQVDPRYNFSRSNGAFVRCVAR